MICACGCGKSAVSRALRSTKWCVADPEPFWMLQGPGSAAHHFANARAAPYPGNACRTKTPAYAARPSRML